jgi:hypothetical protein
MQTLIAILSIVPSLIRVICAVEEAFPQKGAGKEKLSAVKAIMQASYDGIAGMLPAIEQIVAVIVGLANTVGAFKK